MTLTPAQTDTLEKARKLLETNAAHETPTMQLIRELVAIIEAKAKYEAELGYALLVGRNIIVNGGGKSSREYFETIATPLLNPIAYQPTCYNCNVDIEPGIGMLCDECLRTIDDDRNPTPAAR